MDDKFPEFCRYGIQLCELLQLTHRAGVVSSQVLIESAGRLRFSRTARNTQVEGDVIQVMRDHLTDIYGSKILIVDDIPANLAVAVDYLEEQGFQVMVAQDGE